MALFGLATVLANFQKIGRFVFQSPGHLDYEPIVSMGSCKGDLLLESSSHGCNYRLEWKYVEVTNALAFNVAVLMTY